MIFPMNPNRTIKLLYVALSCIWFDFYAGNWESIAYCIQLQYSDITTPYEWELNKHFEKSILDRVN